MKNEIKDLFTNEGEELGISAEEIVLASDEEIYAEAAQIAAASAQDVKYPFVIKYDINWKEFLLDIIDKCGGVVKEEIGDTELAVSVNMTQLKFIKALDCVEGVRVESVDESLKLQRASTEPEENSVLTSPAENGIITTEVQMSDVTEASVASTNIATPGCTTESCCCGGSTMETAIPLTVEELTSVHICCPGSEVWYKFDIEKDRDYTIYSSGGTATGGHLDTIGTLYDADGNQLAYNDDHNGMLYFKICEYLYEGYTYYLKVQVDNNKTGNFYIKVTRDVLVESVTIDPSSVTVLNTKNCQLEAKFSPTTPTETRVKWVSLNKDVATVDWATGKVTAVGVGEATIRAYDWYEHAPMAECTVTVEYCGGDNYRDVTEHTMVLQDDGYYVCSECGYRVKSPELQDCEVLSTDDYLQVISAMHFYTQAKLLAEKGTFLAAGYNIHAEEARKSINLIRKKSQYIWKYEYVDSLGVCNCGDTNESNYSCLEIKNINLLNVGVYNGLYESICMLVIGYYCPEIALLKDVIDLVTMEMDALSFGAFITGFMDDTTASKYSLALTLASTALGVTTSEVCVGDKVVEVKFATSKYAEYIYDSNNKIKFARIFY